ncbi:threonine ammonia-lyase, biosynthetic [Ectothiorhodospira mobilis]|uniref:threonine ammonia-lyase, biosynthetic n=1 Tax=Ectothiorhodospira mobilis TaxID=195064 RepID=UPI001EE83730|nr:threonine ammonia-lyase, biosynthetic [Ectothiorhodospira mobilis]MCG5535764.1 threonine ammonia-lyase, biosynthetic [Ectothiorhodospira mobilis]
MTYPYLQKILTARVYDVARETPLDPMPTLSRRLGNQVLLKREDLQPVFSFKLRGAYNKIVQLPPEVRARGVIAASAGNHAQGVALSARRLGIPAVIVMPRTTPSIKVDAVRALGGEAILHGDSYDEAYRLTQELVAENGYTFIHPFDEPEVIAGQGTVAMELLRQHPDPLDAVFVGVGGGGLLGGMAAYIKALRPDIRVIGVEPDDAPCMQQALEKKRRVVLDQVGIFADGAAVRQAGKETYRLAREYVDEILLVSSDELCAAIKDIFDDTRVMAEPAGALGVAGLKKYLEREGTRDGRYAAVLSGANINFDRLRHVTERAELGEHREALFAATIPERPGSFRAFCEAIGKRAVTEFNYRYADDRQAHVFVGVQLSGGEAEGKALLADLEDRGYAIVDLSRNEMAKAHLRHMVGGHAAHVGDERVYRFEFPERPGALMNFLSHMGQDWNISLFHYRNHGAAYGRVLVGLQVPPEDKTRFKRFLKELGYVHWEETDNPVYRLFLGPENGAVPELSPVGSPGRG